MGFIKSLFSKKALAIDTVKTQERLYHKAKRQYSDKEPHELLIEVYLGRREVIGDDISSEGVQIAAEIETELFSCLYEPNNIKALALYMLYKERHINKNLLDEYPNHREEYEKLVSEISEIKENDPRRYERIYRLHNPRLASELYGKERSEEPKEFQLLLSQAQVVIKDTGKASTAILQQRMSLPYGTAARLIEKLEKDRLIGKSDAAKPRKIYF